MKKIIFFIALMFLTFCFSPNYAEEVSKNIFCNPSKTLRIDTTKITYITIKNGLQASVKIKATEESYRDIRNLFDKIYKISNVKKVKFDDVYKIQTNIENPINSVGVFYITSPSNSVVEITSKNIFYNPSKTLRIDTNTITYITIKNGTQLSVKVRVTEDSYRDIKKLFDEIYKIDTMEIKLFDEIYKIQSAEIPLNCVGVIYITLPTSNILN